MAQGSHELSQAALKRELEQFSSKNFQIDLQIQMFAQQGNTVHIPNFEAAKVEPQKYIVETQIQLEVKKA